MPYGDAPEETHEEPTQLEANPEHGGVVDDDLEAAAQARLGTDDAPAEQEPDDVDDEGANADDVDGGTEGEDEGREGVPSSSPDVIEVADGVSLTREEAVAWAQFGDYLRANPEMADAVAAVLEGGKPEPQPEPQPKTATDDKIPDGIDLDDPAIAALWNQLQSEREHISRLEAMVEQHDDYVTHATQQTTQSLMNQARATYKETHNLSDTDMEKVYDVAGRLQVLPALLAAVDPVTGLPRQIDPLAAMQEAFEIARWNVPELREREMQLKVDEQKSDTKRKKKLSSLGGTSGSVPKTSPEPKTEQERRAAMIAEVASMINGEGAE